MTAVNAAVVTVPSVVLLIYIFITVTIVAKHVIVDTCAVLKKNATVVKFVAETREILAIIPRLIGGFAVSVILGLDVAINADVRSPRMLILRLCTWEPLNLLQTKKLLRRLLHRSQ
eukprot:XP_011453282.1 PREDICTED: uncharacterized protein LOC105346426 [Crassostrea gigas]